MITGNGNSLQSGNEISAKVFFLLHVKTEFLAPNGNKCMDILIQGITSSQLDIRKTFGFKKKERKELYYCSYAKKKLASQNKQVNFGNVPSSSRAVSFFKESNDIKNNTLRKV